MSLSDLLKPLKLFLFILERFVKLEMSFLGEKKMIFGGAINFLELFSFMFMLHINLSNTNEFRINSCRFGDLVDRMRIKNGHKKWI